MRFSSLLFPAAMVVAVSAGCSRPHPKSVPAEAVALRVHVVTARREVAPALVEVPGIVRPVERASIAARMAGTIDSLPLTLGQPVQRGDLLVHLHAPELAARLERARALLAQAEREAERNRKLAAAGADTTDAAQAAEERFLAARAAVAEAEALLAYTEIRAPYDGRIAQKFAYPGDLATPGSPLLLLERASALQVEAAVPASLAPEIKLGAELVVQISGVPAPTTGRVAELAAAADADTHTVLVKLDLVAAAAAWSGRAVRVQLLGEPAEALLVPTSAVSRFGQMERVFVEVGHKAQLRIVRTGATRGDRVEIFAGIAADENVVLAPPDTLRDGQPIITGP